MHSRPSFDRFISLSERKRKVKLPSEICRYVPLRAVVFRYNGEFTTIRTRRQMKGALQVFQMGRQLRKKYWSRLDGAEIGRDVRSPCLRVFSSNYARTQESARCGLLGFYSDDHMCSRSESIPNMDPIAENALDESSRRQFYAALGAHKECSLPRITVKERKRDVIDAFSAQYPAMQERISHLLNVHNESFAEKAKTSGLDETEIDRLLKEMPAFEKPFVWFNVQDTVFCHSQHFDARDSLLPQSVLGRSDTLSEYLCWRFAQYYSDARILRFATESLISELSSNMRDATNDNVASCVWYSGHDVTIMPLLHLLGMWDRKWTPYASYVALELHESFEKPGEFEVRVVYNNRDLGVVSLDAFDAIAGNLRDEAQAQSLSSL